MSPGAPARAGAGEADPGDLGRRVRAAREQLGWTVGELAERAGMAPGYLDYLERRAPAGPSAAAVARLAAALGTTVAALHGAGHERPPGAAGGGPPRPVLEVLDVAECRRLVADGGVGRAVFDGARGPVAVPVNFVVDGDEVVLRTGDSALAAAVRREGELTFEVDQLDEALGEGWSVLVTGAARAIPEAAASVPPAPPGPLPEPWAGGPRSTVVRVVLDELSGRRIRHRR